MPLTPVAGVLLLTVGAGLLTVKPPANPPQVTIHAEGVVIDIDRATSCGLIINELVTNAYKHAFPAGFDCREARHGPCRIDVTMARDGESCILKVSDNGIGLTPGIDPVTTQSLGLKHVNFLARHQLRAKMEVFTANGTEYVIRFTAPAAEIRNGRRIGEG